MIHFLQSDAWKTFQAALGRKVISCQGEGWSYHAYLESGTLNTRLYTPYGPTFASLEEAKTAISSLIEEGKKQHATFVRVEPTTPLSSEIIRIFHMKPVTYQHLQPTDTQIIDLSPTSDELLSGMAQNTRNIVRNYHKKGIAIHTSTNPNDIKILLNLLKKVTARTGLRAQSDTYLATQAEALLSHESAIFYYATYEDKPIAAALFYEDETTRYYAHAAADDDYRKLQAGTALLGQSILDAQSKKLQFFDLYGIAPANCTKNHPWSGFTRFKQSFGGFPITYGGAWDIPLKPFRYRLYRLYQSVYSKLR